MTSLSVVTYTYPPMRLFGHQVTTSGFQSYVLTEGEIGQIFLYLYVAPIERPGVVVEVVDTEVEVRSPDLWSDDQEMFWLVDLDVVTCHLFF